MLMLDRTRRNVPKLWHIISARQRLKFPYSLYMPFLTFSYINILGFLSFIVFLSQLSSGILLSIYYNDFFTIASDPIIYIIININNGWFIRILHVIGASLFILLILLHLIRAIWIKLRIIYIKFIRWNTWNARENINNDF